MSNANVCIAATSEDELFDEGYAAYCCTHRTDRSDCPYPSGSFGYTHWMRGWDYGHEEASE